MDADAGDRLDGNAAAGALGEVFAVELTTALATCEGCGRSSAVAELMLYGGGLGVVLRCPGCEAAMIRLARTPAGHHLDMRGVALLRIAAAAVPPRV
jgi:Family of unknown function (DUF6510)